MPAEIYEFHRPNNLAELEAREIRIDLLIREKLRELLESEVRLEGFIFSYSIEGSVGGGAYASEVTDLLVMQKLVNRTTDEAFWEMSHARS